MPEQLAVQKETRESTNFFVLNLKCPCFLGFPSIVIGLLFLAFFTEVITGELSGTFGFQQIHH